MVIGRQKVSNLKVNAGMESAFPGQKVKSGGLHLNM